MASAVEKLIRAAFKALSSRSLTEADTVSNGSLLAALNNINSEEVGLHEALKPILPSPDPATYIPLFHCPVFEAGIFVLYPGGRLPLHDHPGMFGFIKVIHGELKVRNFTAQELINYKGTMTLKVKADPETILISQSPTAVLTPTIGNIHQIEYSKGEDGKNYAAFVDVLSPPYADGDCRYYEIKYDLSALQKLLAMRPCPAEFTTNHAQYKGPDLSHLYEAFGICQSYH